MSIFCPALKVRYYPVPKTACTSLKQVFYRLIHGQDFAERNIHKIFGTLPFSADEPARLEGEIRVAVIRDPVERFISAYRNRILGHGEAHPWMLKKLGVTRSIDPSPSLNDFVDKLEEYQSLIPAIAHHTVPTVTFLGKDPSFFDYVFEMDALEQFEKCLSQRAGFDVRFHHTQTKGPQVTHDSLGARQQEKLKQYYRADYAFRERIRATQRHL